MPSSRALQLQENQRDSGFTGSKKRRTKHLSCSSARARLSQVRLWQIPTQQPAQADGGSAAQPIARQKPQSSGFFQGSLPARRRSLAGALDGPKRSVATIVG